MNVVISIVVVLIFLSILIVLLSTLFRGESFSLRYSDLLEELAEKHQGKLRLVSFGPYSAVELPLFFGSMLVGVWNRSMSGTHTIPRATISIQSTSFKDIPEFRINSKEGISCGYIQDSKKQAVKILLPIQNPTESCVYLNPQKFLVSDLSIDLTNQAIQILLLTQTLIRSGVSLYAQKLHLNRLMLFLGS
jgi:hypothetical protein